MPLSPSQQFVGKYPFLCLFLCFAACTPARQQTKHTTTLSRISPPPVVRTTSPPPKRVASAPTHPDPQPKPVPPPANTPPPFAHAVLINGGMNPNANYYSHVLHLKLMRQALQERGISDNHITVFSSDGENNNPDLVIQNKLPDIDQTLFNYSAELLMIRPQPRMISTTLPGKRLHTANRTNLNRFFYRLSSQLHHTTPSDSQQPVLVFVTDHGLPNRQNLRDNIICLWRENLHVREYHWMLRPLKNRRIISVMSQCFSGGFAWANYRRPGALSPPTGDRCGFYSTTADRPAYGCYPEIGQQTYVGHAHRFATALRHADTMEEAHRIVNLTDMTPDIPLRSSDSYLSALLQEEAQKQGLSLIQFVDQILARYRSSGYPGYAQDKQLLQSLAQRFQLTELVYLHQGTQQKAKLQQMAQGWGQIEKAWIAAYQSVRNDYLGQWYQSQHTLRQSVMQKFRLYQYNHSLRQQVSESSEVQQVRMGFRQHIQSQPLLWQRIHRLHQHSRDMHQQAFWGQTLLAVVARMEHQLIRIAGRLHLHHSTDDELQPHREGLSRLLSCEATPLGHKKSKEAPKLAQIPPLPVKSAPPYPSWLGVTYRPAPKHAHPLVTPGTVQVRGVYVNTPAYEGGLESGDYIVAVNGHTLQKNYDMREQVMLHPIDKPFVLKVIRNQQIITRTLKLQRFYGTSHYQLASVVGKRVNTWSPLQLVDSQDPLPTVSQQTALVFFWATWCGPCKMALPTLRKLQQQYPQLKIITVSEEAPKILIPWLRQHRLAMPFLNTQDPNGSFGIQLQISATPTFLLLHQGQVVLSHRGFQQMHIVEQAIQQRIRRIDPSDS